MVGAEERPRVAWGWVGSAAGSLLVALALTAGAYGYHRDELYFRMLPPAWGYVDQPPLLPWLARTLSGWIDEPWALRLPAIACAVAAVIVIALIAREAGGGRLAQALAAWGWGFGAFPLLFGHVLLTASVDLLLWPLFVLLVLRAVRSSARAWAWAWAWWVGAGVVLGIGLYGKLLIGVLAVGVAAGIVALGPRRVLRTPWPYLGAAVAVAVGLPNLLYQAGAGWPQLAMGAALSAENGAEVRVLMWPFLALLIGPPLVLFWGAGIVDLVRRPEWRDARWVLVAFGVVLAFTAYAGAQTYYPLGVLGVVSAFGCVSIGRWAAGRRMRSGLAIAAVALNAVVSILISLPVIPVGVLGSTPVPAMNQAVADTVGWPEYVDQVSAVVAGLDTPPGTVAILASNYGEAGALDRYGRDLPPVVSGHNALAASGPPADDVTTLVVVGGQLAEVERLGLTCTVAAELDDGVGVDNEDRGEPIAVCTDPPRPWAELWPALAHLD